MLGDILEIKSAHTNEGAVRKHVFSELLRKIQVRQWPRLKRFNQALVRQKMIE